MRSAALIHNPLAGRGRTGALLDPILRGLERSGFDAEVRPTTAPGSATRLARDAAAAGCDAVFAFGGDGTLREAAAGLLGSRTALGFIPGGTVNVMALALGLPRSATRAAEAMKDAVEREFDVGLCDREPFLMQASAGVDAAFIARLSPRLKRLAVWGALAPAASGALASYRFPQIDLRADGEPLRGTLAVIGNIPFYGGKWRIAPDARSDDGRLDLVLLRGKGRIATLSFARDLLLGRHLERSDVDTRQVEEVELRGPVGLPLQIDGDALATSPPVTIRLASDRLRVLMIRGGQKLPGGDLSRATKRPKETQVGDR